MKKRMIIVVAALVVFFVAIASVKFLQIRAAIAQYANWQQPPEAVTTIVTHEEPWAASLTAIGSVEAVHGVTVSADLPGIVEAVNIDSGRRVGAGDVLVRQDTRQEQAQLDAAESQRDLANLNLARGRQLLDKGVVAQAEFDRLDAEAKQAEARVGEIRATIDRKRIRAPFSGVLGIRQVNLGQYLKGGDPVVPLQSMDPIYVNFALPQGDVAALKLGAEVTVTADSVAGVFAGRVTAINAVVDQATRNVMVQATFRNLSGSLRPGMYVDVQASRGSAQQVIALPASAVSYAPYGNSVFVVSQLKDPKGKTYAGVSQRFVKLGAGRGDQVAVVSGLKPGEEIVTSGVFKLRNGAAVFVNNKVIPSNNPTPKPEDS
ncbi:MAG TPA: efflux RND transporter periplasmic adaptor subunit [Candidatus Eisenbacteria bacterium]|nr:efflux RND transporter periplasmic adaptor subunit [Candidatus Eisenbacteria bacterium]